MPTESPSPRRATVSGALTVAAAALVACSPAADPPAARPATTPTATPTTNGTSDYQDGEYAATGWYGSLPSHQDVTLTIAGDTVTAVEITAPAENPTSLEHQQQFAAALPGAILGRDIDTLNIDRLAGASGCSEGFMNALAEIRDAARSNA